MLVVKVEANESKEATIICPKCGNSQVLNEAKCRKHLSRIVAKCSCDAMFHVVFSREGASKRQVVGF